MWKQCHACILSLRGWPSFFSAASNVFLDARHAVYTGVATHARGSIQVHSLLCSRVWAQMSCEKKIARYRVPKLCLLRLKNVQTARFQCSVQADTNKKHIE